MKRAIQRPLIILSIFFLAILTICIGGFIVIDTQPSLGAQGADMLRSVFGVEAVAWLESAVFQVQDTIHQWEYSLGAKPAAPWSAVSANISSPSAILATESPTGTSASPSITPEISTRGPTVSPSPTLTATPIRWPPASIPAIGSPSGEGQWAPYFTDSLGQIVGYRTDIQPDPARPYAIATIVAIDLAQTRLHYVLGFTEPTSYIDVYRTGKIPQEDRKPGVLLAVFNGGFQTRHGNYGVVVDGKTLMTMRNGLGTLAIFQDGRVQIGVWGTDFTSYDGIAVLRQNGPMIIQGGTINPQTGNDSPEFWGYTVNGKVPTWRSAIGLSTDGKTLYYAVGSNMTIPALAQAFKAAGVDSAIQLDINNYWVLFCRVSFDNNVPTSLPLLDIWNNNYNNNRYLNASARDFFYITAAAG